MSDETAPETGQSAEDDQRTWMDDQGNWVTPALRAYEQQQWEAQVGAWERETGQSFPPADVVELEQPAAPELLVEEVPVAPVAATETSPEGWVDPGAPVPPDPGPDFPVVAPTDPAVQEPS